MQRANVLLHQANSAKLSDFAAQEFVDGKGQRRSLLSPYELTLLTISRGNLDEAERREIESMLIIL